MAHGDRDKTVDILRGFGIVIMIMGHIGIGFWPYDEYFSIWYHAFHMPVFYVLSGYFFQQGNIDENTFIRRKAKSLLIPYAFWGIFHILYNYILCGMNKETLQQSIVNFFVDPTLGQIPIAGALWFLPALFWINTIYFYMSRFFKRKLGLVLASFVVGFGGMAAPYAGGGIHLPMALDAALVGIPFFAAGSLLREMKSMPNLKKHIFHMKWYVFVLLFIICNYFIFYNGEVNFRGGIYNNFILSYMNAMIATILLWNISRVIAERFSRGIAGVFKEILSLIGENSLIYVCLNEWMIHYIRPVYVNVGSENIVWQYMARVLTLATVCFICHVVMKVMEQNNRLRRYVGKE